LSAVVFGQHIHPIVIFVIFLLGLFEGQGLQEQTSGKTSEMKQFIMQLMKEWNVIAVS
jgi:hypothetical protein